MGILGLLLAVVAGLLLGSFWVEVQFPAILGWVLDMHFPWGFATAAAAVTLAMCLGAGVLPALRATRLPVVEALRNE
jgi:ABC-type antimicrobial peptide transport system permease subunit